MFAFTPVPIDRRPALTTSPCWQRAAPSAPPPALPVLALLAWLAMLSGGLAAADSSAAPNADASLVGLSSPHADWQAAMTAVAAATAWPTAPGASERARRTHPLGVQTLALEHERRKGGPEHRVTRVYQYDHDAARARRLRVETATARVLGQRPVEGLHLPLSVAEIDWAVAIARSTDPALRRADPMPTAFVHEPQALDDPCRRSRCALLGFRAADGEVLADERIVEFRNGRVRALGESSR